MTRGRNPRPDERQRRIIETLRRLAREGGRVTFTRVGREKGASPSTIKAAFGELAREAGESAYEYAWGIAELRYSEHTGRKPNDYWREAENRRNAVEGLVLDIARKKGISDRDAVTELTAQDFKDAGLGALLNWYDASPEKAIREVYGLLRKSRRNEFRAWKDAEAHLKDCLRDVDCSQLTEEEFLATVPGGHGILSKHGGFVRAMDRSGLRPFDAMMHRAPKGYWRKKRNRVRWVMELVQRFREETGDAEALPNSCHFRRNKLAGLIATTGKTHIELLREAGFAAAARNDWSQKGNRLRRIREIVEEVGGVELVSLGDFTSRASGLFDWYRRKLTSRADGRSTPDLYEILTDAGFDVRPDECGGRLGGSRWVQSSHGHVNRSKWEAVADEWIYELVGENHEHEVVYPGQSQKRAKFRCDFVLHPPAGDPDCMPLYLEFAGMHDAAKELGVAYRQRLQEKQELASVHGCAWVAITPDKLRRRWKALWREVVLAAPWLKGMEDAAMASPAWKELLQYPKAGSFHFAARRKRYTDRELIDFVRERIAAHLKEPSMVKLNPAACQKDPRFNSIYETLRRRFSKDRPDWWIDLLVEAGMDREEATRRGRLRKRHGRSREEVVKQVAAEYSKAYWNGTWPGREPPLNGALSKRAVQAFGSVPAAREAAKRLVLLRG